MKEVYRLEKEYTVPPEIFEKAYRSYQRKFVYPKSYIFMGLFLFLAADFIYAAIKQPDNTLVYLLIMVCLAFAFREWHNPRFVRRRLTEAMSDMRNAVYKIGVGDGFIDISTVSDGSSEECSNDDEDYDDNEYEDSGGNDDEDTDGLPEKTRINTKEGFKSLEYDEYFLLMQDKKIFYILPKTGFSEEELEIIRKIETENLF